MDKIRKTGRDAAAVWCSFWLAWLLALAPVGAGAHEPALPKGMQALFASVAAKSDVEALDAVAMLDRVPTAEDVAALEASGLQVQAFKHLPMAMTRGTRPQLLKAFKAGLPRDFYPNARLQWMSAESTAAINANLTRELGFDGSGIGIAIVDSGIDASHPALRDRVKRNVLVVSPEYLQITGLSGLPVLDFSGSPALVIPFDALPYNNTDTVGHGTHVAGIAAGDGDARPELVGVAPGADLIGYSAGVVLFIFAALASFDDILEHQAEYNIRVVNNSWGGTYQVFDPESPINVATKVLHDAGITVVFAAGNAAEEMTANPHSMAPWVISVGSGTVSKERSEFSSGGLMYDNSAPVPVGDDGHVHFEGDGLGLSHPDVSAPGSNILGPGTPTGLTSTPLTLPGGSANLSGTSMAAPHVAGLAAVLLQANPSLTPEQVRLALQVTAVPMRDESAFWQSGYGFVDANAAVELVRRADFSQALLERMQAEIDTRVLAARPYTVLRGDQWRFAAQLLSIGGSDTREFTFEVGADTEAIRAGITFGADLSVLGANLLFDWTLELIDPDGNAVGTTTLLPGPLPATTASVGLLHVDFAEAGITPKPGTWTAKASGGLHLSQPALLFSPAITLAVHQLKAQQPRDAEPQPEFRADGELAFRFTGGEGSVPSPEGCGYQLFGAQGGLTFGETTADCQAGTIGYLMNYLLSAPAEFISEPLPAAVTVGGSATLRLYLADVLEMVYGVVGLGGGLSYQIDALGDDGGVLTTIAAGEVATGTEIGPGPVFGEYALSLPVADVPAGARLRLRLWLSAVYTSTARLIWDGAYADAGLTLTTGKMLMPSGDDGSGEAPAAETPRDAGRFGGALGITTLMLLLLACMRRSRQRQR